MKIMRFIRRACLIQQGRENMRRYVAAVEEVAGGDVQTAESICPSLVRLRRAGRACALKARRLS